MCGQPQRTGGNLNPKSPAEAAFDRAVTSKAVAISVLFITTFLVGYFDHTCLVAIGSEECVS
jgi:hypothetical protein